MTSTGVLRVESSVPKLQLLTSLTDESALLDCLGLLRVYSGFGSFKFSSLECKGNLNEPFLWVEFCSANRLFAS